MPVVIHRTRTQLPIRPLRGRGFDAAIRTLAPIIAKFQAAGCLGIQKIADHLNQSEIAAPTGEPFSYTTTRRVVRRLAQLGLAQGPLSSAGSRQHTGSFVNSHLTRRSGETAMEYPVPNITTKLKKPLSKSVVRHNTDMLAAIAKANAEGKTKRVRHLIGRHLKSYDAKLVAAKEAFRKMGQPASKAHIEAVAAKLLPWQGSSEPARLFMKKKGNGDLRPTMNFGLENRSLQYLVMAVRPEGADH
jgi:hypothetical protein